MNNELNIAGLKHGFLAGSIGAILSVIFILIGKDLYITLSGLVSVVIAFAVLIKMGRTERNMHHHGHLSYLAAFVYASIVFFVSGYIAEFTHISICNFIDPEIKETLINEGMKKSEKAFRAIGMEESKIDQGLDELENSLQISFTYYSLISNSWAFLLRAVFLGAIGAFFIKKSKPDFVENHE